MTKKYKHRIDTMDGVTEFEDESPPIRHRTQEELEEEHARLYPLEDIACYLQYPCTYCRSPFFLIHPIRGKNMNPLSCGYMLTTKDDRRIIPACNECVKELSRKNESFRIK